MLAPCFTQSSRWRHGTFTRHGDTESMAWEDRPAPTTTRRRTGHDGGRHRGMGPAFPGLLLTLWPRDAHPYQPTFRSRHGRLLSPTQTSRSQESWASCGMPMPAVYSMLTIAIVAINGWNRIAISTRMEPGQYQSRLTPSPQAESVP